MTSTTPVLAFQEGGRPDGPAVLLLHGFTGSKEDWHDVERRLSEQYRTVAIDLPGHGESASVGVKWFAMATCARAVIDVLDHLMISTCDLIAYSMGGRLAIHLLIHFPDRFGRTVLESTTPGIEDDVEREARRKLDDKRAREIETTSLSAFLMRWYDQPMFAGMRTHGDRFERLLQRRLRGDPTGLSRSLRLMGTGSQESYWDLLPEINQKIRLVVGQFDGKFRALADRMSRLCPHAEVRIIPGSGHTVHFEQPDRFCTEIESFLLSRTS